MPAHSDPSDRPLPTDMEYGATPPMTCSRYGYTAVGGVEYEIALFHRAAGMLPEDEDESRGYGRLEREHEASLREDPYAGKPWLEAVKLVMRERRQGRGWRGYGYATLLHRDRLPATGWQDTVRRWAADPRGQPGDPCAELSAFALAHLVGDDEDVTAAGSLARKRGQFRDAGAAAAIDGSGLVHPHTLRPLVLIERFLVYPGAWRRGLGRAAFDALAETLFHHLRRPWVFVARPSYQRAETEAYLSELSATVPLDELRRCAAAFWAALGFSQFRNTAFLYNIGQPIFAPALPSPAAAAAADDDDEGTSSWPLEGGGAPPPSSHEGLVVWFA